MRREVREAREKKNHFYKHVHCIRNSKAKFSVLNFYKIVEATHYIWSNSICSYLRVLTTIYVQNSKWTAIGSFSLSIFFIHFFLFCFFSSKQAAQSQRKHNNHASDERRHRKTHKKYAIVKKLANAMQCCPFHKTKRFGACRMYQVARIEICTHTHTSLTHNICVTLWRVDPRRAELSALGTFFKFRELSVYVG